MSSVSKSSVFSRTRRLVLGFFIAVLALLLVLSSWAWWGDWPASSAGGEIRNPAIIVVLGGGDGVRVREAARLAGAFPEAPLLVTGDSGFIVQGLRAIGIPESRLSIEHKATSTWENAMFSKPWLDGSNHGQLVLVTNDFHGPRSRGVFRKVYPQHDIVMAHEPTAPPYNKWQEAFRRRERADALYYLVRYGVWSF